MTEPTRSRRPTRLALVATLGALLWAGGASAGCDMGPGSCCCDATSTTADVPSPAVLAPEGRSNQPSLGVKPTGCPEGCTCKSRRTDAPEPGPGPHSTNGRRATANAAWPCPAGPRATLRVPGCAIRSPDPPPASTPVYLSTQRLLI